MSQINKETKELTNVWSPVVGQAGWISIGYIHEPLCRYMVNVTQSLNMRVGSCPVIFSYGGASEGEFRLLFAICYEVCCEVSASVDIHTGNSKNLDASWQPPTHNQGYICALKTRACALSDIPGHMRGTLRHIATPPSEESSERTKSSNGHVDQS